MDRTPGNGPHIANVLFEFRKVGRMVRVSALDPASNTEVTIIAPQGQGQEPLKRVALRKLLYVLSRKTGRSS